MLTIVSGDTLLCGQIEKDCAVGTAWCLSFSCHCGVKICVVFFYLTLHVKVYREEIIILCSESGDVFTVGVGERQLSAVYRPWL